MQEEAIPISEEEASDSEIVMISHHRQSMQQQSDEQNADRHLRSHEKILDNQLKALGLFEEGLSFEQKEELLAVVAASRETAEHEESIRVQAKEWQQQVFPNSSEFETVAQLNESNENSSSPGHVDDSIHHLNVDEDDCLAPDVSRDGSSEIDDPPSKDSEDPSGAADQNYETVEVCSKRVGNRKGHFRRGGKGRGQTGSLKVSPPSSLAVDLEVYEPDPTLDQQAEQRKQRKDLAKFMLDWKPCLSPQTDIKPLVDKRLKDHQESAVPCKGAEEYDVYKSLCDSIDQYHISLNEFQRTATEYIPWGQPLTVGRAYATRSTRGRVSEMESADGVFSYQSQGVSDSTFLMENADGDKYIQLQQYGKVYYQGFDFSSLNCTRTISPFPVVTALSTTDTESSVLLKRTRYATRGESSSTSTDNTVISKEETIVDVEAVVSSGSATSLCSAGSSKRAVVSGEGAVTSEGSPQKASGLRVRSKGYFSSETVTRIEDASSDSSVDIESFDAEFPVRKDGSKTYSSKEQQSVAEDPARQEEEMEGEEVVAEENSSPDALEASSQSQQDSKTDSCSSVKRKRTTAASSSPKVNTSPSKRWKESGIA